MHNLSKVTIQPTQRSNYITPLTIHYTLNGKKRITHIASSRNCVAVIIYNKTRKSLVLVKQFRPPSYFSSIPLNERLGEIDVNKYPADIAIVMGLCSGIVDKQIPLRELAAEEILEECGYNVNSCQLKKLHTFPSDVNMTTTANVFYCEVTDAMKVGTGGGVRSELIEVVDFPVSQVKDFLIERDFLVPPYLLFSFYWFLTNKCHCIVK